MIVVVVEVAVECRRVKKTEQVTDIKQKYMPDVKGINLGSLQRRCIVL